MWSRQETPLAKPNYQFEKRQRELEKKRKKEEKAMKKSAPPAHPAPAVPAESTETGFKA